jgi:predicted nucleic acid-binding protein
VLVVDAALVVELALDRVGEQAGSLLGDQELLAPCLLWSEVPSVINEMAFRGEISRGLADSALERFLAGKLDVSERRHADLTTTALSIAGALGWAKPMTPSISLWRGYSIHGLSPSICAYAVAPSGWGSS